MDKKRNPDRLPKIEKLRPENLGRAVRANKEAVRETVILTMPNVVSALRIGLAPLLIWLALEENGNCFLWVLGLSLFTDTFDGYLARRLDQVTELGMRLDSWADMITYAIMLLGLWSIWPELYDRESSYLILALSCWLVPTLVCLARFGKLPCYHTHAAKIAAVAVAPSYFVMTLWGHPLAFRAALIFYLWVAVEQVIITSILPYWRGNVSSLFQALAIARKEHQAEQQRRRQ